jgi:4-alpha-glucanotransferase
VGEDLGTVPPGVRAGMRRHAVARTWIYLWSVRPRAARIAAEVPADSLATLGTHDMVPLAGFVEGDDVRIRVETGQLTPRRAEREFARRRRLVARLSRALNVSDAGPAQTAGILAGALAHLGRSAARMVLVNLEDLLLEREPQNVPGTSSERPNWRHKVSTRVEELPGYRYVSR